MLEDKVTRDTLVEVLFAHTTTLVEVQRAMCLIIHGLSHVRDQATTQKDLLLLSAAIVQRARGTLTTAEFAAIQNQLFVQSGEIKVLCFSKSLKCVTQEGMRTVYPDTLIQHRLLRAYRPQASCRCCAGLYIRR